MPKYIISSETPIVARQVSGLHPDNTLPRPERPVDPGWGIPETGDGIWGPTDPRPTPPIALPGLPSFPERPSHPWVPPLPDTWPPLPPGVALPIPPTPEHPIAPLPDEPEIDPPTVWPPIRPEFPDLSGKTLVLALLYVSRHEPVWGWVVVDHEEAKEKFKAAVEKIKEWRASRPQPK